MRVRFCIALLLFPTWPEFAAQAHDSLYNYLEIRVETDGAATIHFSVHAAELSDDPEVDPTSPGTEWFSQLSPTETGVIVERANKQLNQSYRILSGENEVPNPAISPRATLDSEIRPGCFSAALEIPSKDDLLTVFYTGSEKRLLLVITSPGAFPKTFDLASGEKQSIPLPRRGP